MVNDGKVRLVDTPAEVIDISEELLGGATHLVQMVEIEVRVTVETVVVTSCIAVVPEMTVFVTGQVVRVV